METPFAIDDREQQLRLLEALLFATAAPLAARDMAARLPAGADVEGLLRDLQRRYEGRGVVLRQLGDSWAFRTAADLGPLLDIPRDVPRKPGRAALETLAIIAYHQPVTRAEIEDIRGVALSRGTLDFLLEAGWVRPRGRRDAPGRPMTWVTTPQFLDHFGLDGLDSLPGVEELRAAGLLDPLPADGALITEQSPPLPDAPEDGHLSSLNP